MANHNSYSLPSPSQFFPTSVVKKLDDSNYLHWKQQLEPIINAQKLHRFVVNLIIPTCFLNDGDREYGTVNPSYEKWEVQDQILLASCNLPSPRKFYLVFLVLFTPIKYGSIFMKVSLLKPKPVCINFVLIFESSLLTTSPCTTS